MPKRTINTRRNKATDTIDISPATLAELLASTEPAPEPTTTTEPTTDTTTEPAPELTTEPAPEPATTEPAPEFTTTEPTTEPALTPHPVPTSDAVPVAATPAVPDAKAAFLERKANATLSAISQYAGASLAVHRSDKQPADATYLARVASPVQKIGPNGPTVRDNSFILAVYDYLTTYFAGNYAVGFNPANFGADLGTTSRAASVGYLALTDDASDIVLTPTGIERGALLTRKRAEAAAKAAK